MAFSATHISASHQRPHRHKTTILGTEFSWYSVDTFESQIAK